jgi:hypothetical protein
MFMAQKVIKMGLAVYNLNVTLVMIQNPYMGDYFKFNKMYTNLQLTKQFDHDPI